MTDAINAKNQILALTQDLNQHNHAYHVANEPTITDGEYDQLFKQLQVLEAKYPQFILPDSPSHRAGHTGSSHFTKVKHTVPMLSLENVFSTEELHAWLKSNAGSPTDYAVESKVDGLSLSLKYVNGMLVQAVTRGDHETGDDVTANAKTIKDIPLRLPNRLTLEVRGEVYLAKKNFDKLNSKLPEAEKFANPRNAAAGSLKQKDSKICASRELGFFAYYVVNPAATFCASLQTSLLVELVSLGFKQAYSIWAKDHELATVIKNFSALRQSLPYDIDGCVIKVNSLEAQKALGNKTRAPRWAVAYKFEAAAATTTLLGVTCQVGRSGKITPVAELAPVECGGATVSRATLHNQNQIDLLSIGIGDIVEIERRGDVIPAVAKVVQHKASTNYQLPRACPCCQSLVVRHGADYFCENTACSDQVKQRLQHAVSKGALDWDGFGTSTVAKFVDLGVTKMSQIFELTPAWLNENFTQNFAAKFLAEREKAKNAPLWRKIFALGIDRVGQTSSKDLCAAYPEGLLQMIEAGAQNLAKILGPVAAENFLNFLTLHVQEISRLDELGYTLTASVQSGAAPQTGALTGKSFCLSGSMENGTRPEVAARIEAAGGTVKGSCSKDVNYLVSGPGAGEGKARAAAKYGTKVISEVALFAMAGWPFVPAEKPKIDEY